MVISRRTAAPAHRLRRRLLRRPLGRRRARGALRSWRWRSGRPDVRDARRAHAGAGAAAPSAGSRGGLRTDARHFRRGRCSRDCVRHAIPIVGNFGAANPRAAAAQGARPGAGAAPRPGRASRWWTATTSRAPAAPRRSALLPPEARGRPVRERQRVSRRARRSPKPARRRAGRRHRPRRRSVARARARCWRTSAGAGRRTGTAWPPPRWPGICSSAARR